MAAFDPSGLPRPPPTLQRELSDEGKRLLQEALDESDKAPANHTTPDDNETSVKVCVRIRPSADKPAARSPLRLGTRSVGGRPTVQVDLPATGKLEFPVHAAYDQGATQADVADFMVENAVDKVLCGINAAMLVYGQTGSGKTYTMEGALSAALRDPAQTGASGVDAATASPNRGIIPRTFEQLFNKINTTHRENPVVSGGNVAATVYDVRASYLQIYKEKIHDLLVPERAELRVFSDKKMGLHVTDATAVQVKSAAEATALLVKGSANREVAETLMNRFSSRAHSIFLLTVTRQHRGTLGFAQLYMVDLAGSECALKSGATGVRLVEAGHINRSLLTLGMCVNALCEQSRRDSLSEEQRSKEGLPKKIHIPYRDSKLTRLLQNALGGNSATWLMVAVSPDPEHLSESIMALRFGYRAMALRNTQTANVSLNLVALRAKVVDTYRRSARLAAVLANKGSEARLVAHALDSIVKEKGDEGEEVKPAAAGGGVETAGVLRDSTMGDVVLAVRSLQHIDTQAAAASALMAVNGPSEAVVKLMEAATSANGSGRGSIDRAELERRRANAPSESVRVFCRLRPQLNETLPWTSVVRRWSPSGALDFGLRDVDANGEPLPEKDDDQMGGAGGDFNVTQEFSFNGILGPQASQQQVFEQVGPPLIDAVMNGTNAACLAYGQTGSGKTFTMAGNGSRREQAGIAYRCVSDVFERIATNTRAVVGVGEDGVSGGGGQNEDGAAATVESMAAEQPTDRYVVSLSAVEVYMETVRDILVPRHKLRCPAAYDRTLETRGRFDSNATSHDPARCACGGMVLRTVEERIPQAAVVPVTDAATAHRLIHSALRNRRTAPTPWNDASSRSHAFILVKVKHETLDASGEAETSTEATLTLVDLAGSESSRTTMAKSVDDLSEITAQQMRQRQLEGQAINTSLLALRKVIQVCSRPEDEREERAPVYRESKVTMLLKKALSSDGRTSVVLNVSQHSNDAHHTLPTLQFGAAASKVMKRLSENRSHELSAAQLQASVARGALLEKRLLMLDASIRPDIQALPRYLQAVLAHGNQHCSTRWVASVLQRSQFLHLPLEDGRLALNHVVVEVCMFLKPFEILACVEVSRYWARAINTTERLWACVLGDAAQAAVSAREAELSTGKTSKVQVLRDSVVEDLRSQWREKVAEAGALRDESNAAQSPFKSGGVSLIRGRQV